MIIKANYRRLPTDPLRLISVSFFNVKALLARVVCVVKYCRAVLEYNIYFPASSFDLSVYSGIEQTALTSPVLLVIWFL